MIIVYLLEFVAPGHATEASNKNLIKAPRGGRITVSLKMTQTSKIQKNCGINEKHFQLTAVE